MPSEARSDVFRMLDSGGDGVIDVNEFVAGMTAATGDQTRGESILRRHYEHARDEARKAPNNKALWREYENAYKLLQKEGEETSGRKSRSSTAPTEDTATKTISESNQRAHNQFQEDEWEEDDFSGVALELWVRPNEKWLSYAILAAWIIVWLCTWGYFRYNIRRCVGCTKDRDLRPHYELLDPDLDLQLGTQEWVCILAIPVSLIVYFMLRSRAEYMRLRGTVVIKTVCFIVIAICLLEHSGNIQDRYQWVEVSEDNFHAGKKLLQAEL